MLNTNLIIKAKADTDFIRPLSTYSLVELGAMNGFELGKIKARSMKRQRQLLAKCRQALELGRTIDAKAYLRKFTKERSCFKTLDLINN